MPWKVVDMIEDMSVNSAECVNIAECSPNTCLRAFMDREAAGHRAFTAHEPLPNVITDKEWPKSTISHLAAAPSEPGR